MPRAVVRRDGAEIATELCGYVVHAITETEGTDDVVCTVALIGRIEQVGIEKEFSYGQSYLWPYVERCGIDIGRYALAQEGEFDMVVYGKKRFQRSTPIMAPGNVVTIVGKHRDGVGLITGFGFGWSSCLHGGCK